MHSVVCPARLSQLTEKISNYLQIFLCQLGMTLLSRIFDVLLQELVFDIGEYLFFVFQERQILNIIFLGVGVILDMGIDHECTELIVNLWVYLISDHIQNIKTRKDGI